MPPGFFEKLGDYIIEVLKTHGAVVLCLVGAVWYFYQDNSKIKNEQAKCAEMLNQLKIEIIKNDHEVIMKNSIEFDRFRSELEKNTVAVDRLIRGY